MNRNSRRSAWVFLASSLSIISIISACDTRKSAPAPPVSPPYQAISLLGDTLREMPLAENVRKRYEDQLLDAERAYEHTPSNADSIIWYGRRLGYLGRMREAIEVFSRGITLDSDNPWLYRHRGHRFLSVREFDAASGDLERAAALVTDRPDQVEPDGQPNAENKPISTLQSNILYHLALAYYLKGDYGRAAQVARQELAAANNDDRRVAIGHWLYTSLRRLGQDSAAASVAAPFSPDMQIVENQPYHKLMLLYKGVIPVDSVLAVSPGKALSVSEIAAAYGVASWYAYNGHEAEAEAIWRQIVASGQWAAFGSIAAEVDLAHLRAVSEH